MTLAERSFLTRKARYEQPAQATQRRKGGGVLGDLLGGVLGNTSGSAPITADQGPLPDGGNLGQPGLTPTYTGGEGTHFITLGNPNREQIKLGRFFKPRVNQEAAAALAADPLAPVQPEVPTTGVGGFFRRMFGDNANERNAALAEQQGRLRLQKWLIDQEAQAKMGVLGKQNELALQLADKQQQYEMERIKAREAAEQGNIQYRTQLELQGDQLRNQWAIDNARKMAEQERGLKHQAVTDAVGDPVLASNVMGRMITDPLDRMAAETTESLGRAKYYEQGGGRSVRGGSDGFKVPPSLGYDPLTDSYTRWNDLDGKFESIPRSGGQPQAGGATGVVPNDALNERVKQMVAEAEQRQQIGELTAPPSAMGGIKALTSDAGNVLSNFGKQAMAVAPVTSGLQALGGEFDAVKNWLIEQDRLRRVNQITPTN